MILGLGVFFAAFFTLRKAGTAFDPLKITSALVTHGIFRLTRNPAYLGGVITYTGINLLGSGLVSLILLPVIIIIIQRYAIRREEVYLEKCFGHMYKEYQNRVRQWI